METVNMLILHQEHPWFLCTSRSTVAKAAQYWSEQPFVRDVLLTLVDGADLRMWSLNEYEAHDALRLYDIHGGRN